MALSALDAMLSKIRNDSNVNNLLEASPVCHKIFGPDFTLKFMSQSGVSALNIENVDEIYGKIFPPESAPQSTRNTFNEAMQLAAQGETNTIEYFFEVNDSSDGEIVWYRTTITPTFDPDGTLSYISAHSMDITSAKKNEETNRLLLETTDVCLKEILRNSDDSGYSLKFMSPAGLRQIGISDAKEIYGRAYPIDSYPDKTKKILTETLNQVVTTGETAHVECEVIDAQGNPVWYLSTFSVHRRNDSGRVISLTGASLDITNKRSQEVALAKAKEEADKANQAKSLFLSRMSHELRTPLNAIIGFSQLLELDPDQDLEKRQESVGHILFAGRHLLNLVNEVLDLNRIDSGEITVVNKNINATTLIESLAPQVMHIAKERSITISNRLDLHKDIIISADAKAFSQVILNLLSNSINYNHKGGSVIIDGGDTNTNQRWISVSDDGPGIAKENIESMFIPFNRLGQEYGDIKGTGIGLNISKMLIELMGGEISVESELGKGCCIKLILPAATNEISSKHGDNLNPPGSVDHPSHYKILYIEDDPQNLRLVEKIFESEPDVIFYGAMNTKDGIDIAMENQPNLILMDIQLPEMNGFMAFNELKKNPETREIPVIALSGLAMNADIDEAMNAGFKDYITKPVDVSDFLKKIHTMIGDS